MKVNNCSMLVIVILLLSACSISRNISVIRGGENEAIEIAINDFLKSCYLRKYDNVFFVILYNENPNYLGVTIYGVDWEKIFVTPNTKIGEKSTFPTRYIEKGGKLFYWDDSTKVLTAEMVSVLSRYDHIDSTYYNKGFNGEIIMYSGDEKKRGANYYFCRNNFAKYKRVITSRAIGGHETPKLKCDKK